MAEATSQSETQNNANGNGSGKINGDGNGQEVTEPVREAEVDRLAEPTGDGAQPRLPFTVVGVGASAGGLEAYSEFLAACAPDSGMAFVLIQHLSPKHQSMLAEILGKTTKMPVRQVEDNMAVEPNHVYVIRPGHTLTIAGGRLHLGENAAERMHRRPVDDFFKSLADEQRERAVAVILSGTGSNGTLGCESIKAVGGFCIAEDPQSARYPSMPRSLIDAHLADAILRPREMFTAINNYATHSYATGEDLPPEKIAQQERRSLDEILAVLRARTRHDFTVYKKPTIIRRIQRRMSLMQIERMVDYAKALRQTPSEMTALADDLMIHVTGFFRDPEVWESLRRTVIQPMVADKPENSTIRCWVTACSSGEEAYTIGILMLEAAEQAGKHFDIKIFATDTAERSLNHARLGIFPGGIESEIAPDRLDRFFNKDDASYRVKKELREIVTFAPQNVLQDPPFSRLDLCTCRNLLIYIEGETQRRILNMLHFGLRDGGTLLLGNSETITGSEDLFEPLDKQHRIYRKVGPSRHGSLDFPVSHHALAIRAAEQFVGQLAPGEMPAGPRASIAMLASKTLLDKYTPAAVVVDRSGQIVHFHGQTKLFWDQPGGEPTRDILMLVREEIRGGVRAVLQKVMVENTFVRHRNGTIGEGDDRQRVEFTAAPLGGNTGNNYYLITFQLHSDPPPVIPPEGDGENGRMNEELARVRDELQSTIEELQTSNEEMKASHEEVTSINEELQSTNEELETSKEELQSLNEELTTVNAQFEVKMQELERTGDDLQSLLSSTEIAVIFLDRGFRIRRYTPSAKELVELIPSDVGRPLKDLALKFNDDTLVSDAARVLEKLVPVERELIGQNGHSYVRRVLPYRTGDDRINGVVLTFFDMSERRKIEDTLRASEERFRKMLNIDVVGVLAFDDKGVLIEANDAFLRMSGYSREEVAARVLHWKLMTPPEFMAESERQMAQLSETGRIGPYEKEYLCKDGSRSWMLFAGAAMGDGTIVEFCVDVNERRRAAETLRKHEALLRRVIDAPTVGVLFFDLNGKINDANATFERMSGYSADELREMTGWAILTSPKFSEVTEKAASELADQGETSPYEKEMIRRDGSSWRGLFAPARLSGEGRNSECVEFVVDITDRQFVAANETLRQAKESAEQANRMKDEFLATLSHELRTPLSAILIYAKLLRGQADAHPAFVEGLDAINRSAEAQKQLIDDLLDSSRITSGKLRLEMRPTALEPLVRESIETVRATADVKGIKLVVNLAVDAGTVQADPDRLRQVIWNLLNNAVKFTPSGGSVEVVLSRRGPDVSIQVSDTGQGIHKDFLPHVFEPFRQADASASRGYGGLGLGLSICKRLIEQHGGTINAQSEGPGQGAIFTVLLPLPSIDKRKRTKVEKFSKAADFTGLTILLVEDEAEMRNAVTAILKKAGATVQAVVSSHAALEAFAKSTPDLIVSDIGMPEEDGYTLIQKIRQLEAKAGTTPVPAAALSAFTRNNDREKALQAGFNRHIGKPVEPDVLLSTLQELVAEEPT